MPEGYILRHVERGMFEDQPYRRGVVIYRGDEKVADMEHFRDAATDKWRFGAKLRDGKMFHDYDLDKLVLQVCVYHRLTGGGPNVARAT
jgi:hypothetical protein